MLVHGRCGGPIEMWEAPFRTVVAFRRSGGQLELWRPNGDVVVHWGCDHSVAMVQLIDDMVVYWRWGGSLVSCQTAEAGV